MSAAQDFAALRRLTPAEAVAYLQRRQQITQTYSWRDLWQEEHAEQFTVSRLAQADLLQSVQDQITRSVGGDLSRTDFVRDVRQILQAAGWWGEREVVDPNTGEILRTTFDPSRLRLIFDTNTRMAYAAGQWERIEQSKIAFPYVRYITQGDDKVRPAHRAWNNVTLPVGDAFWTTHNPPNGWRCRCRIVAVSRRDYEVGMTPTGDRMRKDAPEVVMRDWLDKNTGQVRSIPAGIDPGFGYNPGVASMRARSQRQVVQDRLDRLSPPLAEALKKSLARNFVEAKTAKAAAEWAVQNDLADFSDYTGIKPEAANAWNRAMVDHLEEFPELRANQRFIGTAQAQVARWREIEIERYIARLKVANPNLPDTFNFRKLAEKAVKSMKIPANRMAQSWMQKDVSGVAINKAFGADIDRFKQVLRSSVDSKFHPVGSDTIRSVADHEMGHQLDALLNLKVDTEVLDAYKSAKLKGVQDEVSGYADKNVEEFIAECWAEACNNPAPRPYARTIAAIIRSRYQSKFGSSGSKG